MSVETIEILEPGLFTTVQDRGRYGYQRYGVPSSGAMDTFALRAANILVGNEEGAAGLEMTVLGPRIRFLADTWIALTGADLGPTLDGEPLVMWQTAKVQRDGVLSFEGARDGTRSYLAAAGGLDIPLVMGSRSTYVTAAIGGLDGRPLKPGDILSTFGDKADVNLSERGLPESLMAPSYGHQHEIRVVLGPQDESFAAEAIATFLSSEYAIGLESDRMGYRLDGPRIEHKAGPDIVSDGTPLGAVQIPGDGQPIILLADRGTTGGYTKIATVISADIGTLAQAMPGNALTFRAVTVDEAQAVLREREAVLADIRRAVVAAAPRELSILVEGEAFEVLDESGARIASADSAVDGRDGRTGHAKATIGGHTYEFDVNVRRGRPEGSDQ